MSLDLGKYQEWVVVADQSRRWRGARPWSSGEAGRLPLPLASDLLPLPCAFPLLPLRSTSHQSTLMPTFRMAMRMSPPASMTVLKNLAAKAGSCLCGS